MTRYVNPRLGEEERNVLSNHVRPRLQAMGEFRTWTGVTDYMWGRLTAVLSGSLFIACVPLKYYRENINHGWTMEQCATNLSSMTLADVESAHGTNLIFPNSHAT